MPAQLAVPITLDLLHRLSTVAEQKELSLDDLVTCVLVAGVHKAEHAAPPRVARVAP